LALGAALNTFVGFPAFVTLAQAEPPYSVDTVVAIFVKDKAVAEAYKHTTPARSICIGHAAECPKKEAPAPASFDLLLSFRHKSDKLTRADKNNLNRFAKALLDPRLKGEKFEIDSHTNAEKDNLRLSERRAISVVSYLAFRGADRSSLLAKGFGATKPRVADPRSPKNSRVEVHLMR
jgi:outer membrane protein OmpA-like peptidoglycan-associated protein